MSPYNKRGNERVVLPSLDYVGVPRADSRHCTVCTKEQEWTREGVRRGPRGLHSEDSQPVVVSIVWMER